MRATRLLVSSLLRRFDDTALQFGHQFRFSLRHFGTECRAIDFCRLGFDKHVASSSNNIGFDNPTD